MCKLSKRAAVAGASFARVGGRALVAAVLVAGLACAFSCRGAEALETTGRAATRAKAKKPAAPAALPCARAGWKDDPVCFGENDPDALPVPSAQSGAAVKSDPKHAQDMSITPKAGAGGSDPQPLYSVDPHANPSPRSNARELNGGIGVGVPF
jgi:hypothetical protein